MEGSVGTLAAADVYSTPMLYILRHDKGRHMHLCGLRSGHRGQSITGARALCSTCYNSLRSTFQRIFSGNASTTYRRVIDIIAMVSIIFKECMKNTTATLTHTHNINIFSYVL